MNLKNNGRIGDTESEDDELARDPADNQPLIEGWCAVMETLNYAQREAVNKALYASILQATRNMLAQSPESVHQRLRKLISQRSPAPDVVQTFLDEVGAA